MTLLTGSLFERAAPHLYSIDPGRSFLDTLAHFLIHETYENPLTIADYTVYLPTRRAMRGLSHAIISASPHKTCLLPKIKTIGVLDDDHALTLTHFDIDQFQFPQAISGLERKLILAKLAARQHKVLYGEDNWSTALSTAGELEKLLDSFYTEEIDFCKIDDLTPEDRMLAAHWQRASDFLSIITTAWPAYLNEQQRMDGVARRIALIRQTGALWKQSPPKNPVIIAGSTGSTPAVADLMAIAAHLPKGCVILPGIDHILDEQAWDVIDDAHPQSGLKALINKLGYTRNHIKDFPIFNIADTSNTSGEAENKKFPNQEKIRARQNLLSLAMRPAEKTDDWLAEVNNLDKNHVHLALENFKLAELPDAEAEASAVALYVRQSLTRQNETVMLVTPDRNLARRVEGKLKRWNIEADDSGGVPFPNTRCGTFLQLVAAWLTNPADPVALLTVLRHQLSTVTDNFYHQDSKNHLTPALLIEQIDISLRGIKPGFAFSHLIERIRSHFHEIGKDDFFDTKISPFLTILSTIMAPWCDLHFKTPNPPMKKQLEAHLKIAEILSQINALNKDETETMQNPSPLWLREDGIMGASLMRELLNCADLIPNLSATEYATIFTKLVNTKTVRRTRPAHPRVTILGPLEARLQKADHIILAGLNEGVWPADAQMDGFLSRPMRKIIGLPSPERRIGLSAHDFSQHCANARVTLTRSLRAGSAPSTPSRWLVRLNNILLGLGMRKALDHSEEMLALIAKLDTPATRTKILPPHPTPPLDARPKRLAVTRIESWLRDPYSIYARYVLKLRKLDQFHDEFGPRHLGQMLHRIFEDYTNPDAPVPQNIIALFEKTQATYHLPAHLVEFYRPAFLKSLSWFGNWHKERAKEGTIKVIEEKGTTTLTAGSFTFTLEARADRIDEITTTDGLGAALYDFKTGTLKSLKQSKNFSPQLALTALIVEEGGFENINCPVLRQAYIKSFNRSTDQIDPDKDISTDIKILNGKSSKEATHDARRGLINLISIFANEQTPYLSQPRPEYNNSYGDYDQLARRSEWSSERDNQDEGTS